MAEVINKISNYTKGNSIIVTDVGQHQMVTSRYYKFNKPNSNITSGGLGTMGFALPAAMGAKIGQPDREVIAIIGDGGIQMTIQELATIAQFKIRVKILILNNNFLGMVRQWQELFFDNRYSFTEMENPDFNVISDGYSIKNNIVKEKKDLDKAIKEFLNCKDSFLLNVIVEKEENVFPMVPSGESVSNIRLE
jgi:acetolactate synthase-1/2/3 large subunit